MGDVVGCLRSQVVLYILAKVSHLSTSLSRLGRRTDEFATCAEGRSCGGHTFTMRAGHA